jgi:hypothetical protein
MQANFAYYNIIFEKKGTSSWIFAKGDISNNSSRNYNTAMFRLTLFAKTRLLWTGSFKIRSFRKGQMRPFEIILEKMDPSLVSSITKHEIYFESGY